MIYTSNEILLKIYWKRAHYQFHQVTYSFIPEAWPMLHYTVFHLGKNILNYSIFAVTHAFAARILSTSIDTILATSFSLPSASQMPFHESVMMKTRSACIESTLSIFWLQNCFRTIGKHLFHPYTDRMTNFVSVLMFDLKVLLSTL